MHEDCPGFINSLWIVASLVVWAQGVIMLTVEERKKLVHSEVGEPTAQQQMCHSGGSQN